MPSSSDSIPTERRSTKASERTLAQFWRRTDSLPGGLATTDGRTFRVLYPGRPNARAGPDFRDAVLASESGQRIVGDVELHLDASGWRGHGHHADPRYNGVVLEVVLTPKRHRAVTTHARIEAPVAVLAPAMPDAPPAQPAATAWPGGLASLDDEALGRLLDEAGDRRFAARAHGFAIELRQGDPDQVLYASLMEALGYAVNRRPLRELAKRVPYAALTAFRGEPRATRLLAIHATLSAASGLLPWVRPDEEAAKLRAMARLLPRRGAMPPESWERFRIRPANHPARRVLGAASLLDRFLDTGLVKGLVERVRGEDSKALPNALVGGLSVPPRIGPGRAGDMAVNVVLPFLHAWALVRRDAELTSLTCERYRRMPALEENEVTREMRRLLGSPGRRVEAGTARRHQGLMHLYRTAVTGAAGPPA